jgi:hypothetical protein
LSLIIMIIHSFSGDTPWLIFQQNGVYNAP